MWTITCLSSRYDCSTGLGFNHGCVCGCDFSGFGFGFGAVEICCVWDGVWLVVIVKYYISQTK
jgi:hypothetical protein